jgi:hypothetical protein
MSPAALTVDVYVAPMRPFAGAPGPGPGDDPMWSPMSSTLIAGAERAILVDTLVTLGQVDALADWVRGFGKRITGVYITHGHQDHWIGLARIQEHFPEARGIATPEVVRRATFEATDPGLSAYWKASFPGELPGTPVLPEALTAAETDENSREAWIASLDKVAALNPQIVVAGHKSVGAPDQPESIGASQQYLRDFTRIVNQGGSVEDIVTAMLKLHGDRDNPRTLWHSARTAVAKRG